MTNKNLEIREIQRKSHDSIEGMEKCEWRSKVGMCNGKDKIKAVQILGLCPHHPVYNLCVKNHKQKTSEEAHWIRQTPL